MTDERTIYTILLILEFIACPLVAIALIYITAPYGRYFRKDWGPWLNFKFMWFLMEAAAILSFGMTFFQGGGTEHFVPFIFFLLWQIHYVDRAFLFPLRLPASNKQMPVAIFIMGVLFNLSNGYLNARALTFYASEYSLEWLIDWRFIVGISFFIAGFSINRYADDLLLKLRKPGETDYKIPQGRLFDYLSCPNYSGEVLEWFGWAIATWSLPGLAFALFTAANLMPRAYAHHCWYRSQFKDYPERRKAILPFLF